MMWLIGNPGLLNAGFKNFARELCTRRGYPTMVTFAMNKISLVQKTWSFGDVAKLNVCHKPTIYKRPRMPSTQTYNTSCSFHYSAKCSTKPPDVLSGAGEAPKSSSNFLKWEVLDLDEVTEFLTVENATDVVVIQLPKQLSYVDYFIVATGMSGRHIASMAILLNKLYKQKRKDGQPFANIEGMGVSENWQCIDIGNMVIHLMLEEVREKYQLEKLWTLGPKNDDLMREKPSAEEIVRHLTSQGLSLMSMNQDLVTAVGDEDEDFDDIEDLFNREEKENILSDLSNSMQKLPLRKEDDSDEDAFLV